MKFRKSIFAIGLFVSIASLGAAAAGRDAAISRKIDADGDGRISREEAAKLPRLAKYFDALDTNKDGYVTRAEMIAARQKVALAHFKRVDTDGDGRISRQEATAKAPRLAKHFDAIDTNKDGYLSKEELRAARQAARTRQ